MDPTYTGAYGRIKVYETEFLSEDLLRRLADSANVEEISSLLYTTFYRQDMDLFSALHKGVDLIYCSQGEKILEIIVGHCTTENSNRDIPETYEEAFRLLYLISHVF